MFRREFLKTAAFGMAWFARAAHSKNRKNRPNIVLIMADDLGYECLSCNGSLSYRTPVLDHLAEQGVRFTHAHAQPLCTPTRVQLMTGKYNFRNYTQFGSLKPGEYTFGHLLQDAGYKTCVVGKWQLAGRVRHAAYKAPGTLPGDAGFDEYCLWQIKEKGSRYWDPWVNYNGELRKDLKGKFGPDLFCDYAVDFIHRHADQPFFLYFPMALTHSPFVPTPDSPGVDKMPPETLKKNDPAYFGDMVEYMDKLVGKIVEKLKSQNILKETLLIFAGDNGTHRHILTQTKAGPVQGDKGRTTIAGTHVPLIVYWDGVTRRGRVCGDLIDFTDFFPTLAEAAEIDVPPDYPGDGISFLPQIKGQHGMPRDWIFFHYDPKWGKWQKARFVMDHRFKLYDDGRFFDIEADPKEQQPIAEPDVEQRMIKARLQRVLASFPES